MRWRKEVLPACGRAVFLVALLSSTTAHCADSERSIAPPMPSMLKGVRLGMSVEELRRSRPAVELFEIFGEPEVQGDDPNPLYYEQLANSPFFDTVAYAFCALKLCNVSLSATGQGEPFADREARILQGSMRRWGSDPEHLLSVSDEIAGVQIPRYKVPALLWRLDSLRILLTFSPQGPTAPRQPPGIALSIFDPERLRQVLRQDPYNSLIPVPPAEDARLFALLDRQVEPPLFD
jgi:hypothetical protein